MDLRQKAIKKIANLEWAGVDYQEAVVQVLYESEEFEELFEDMDEDEKAEEANSISSDAASYNERGRK